VTRGKGDWRYGRVEVRARIPRGRGTWPAIWMLPTDWAYGGWPDSGEIDIMEHVGYDHGRIHGTIHTGSFNHMRGTQRGGSVMVAEAADGFHTYAIEWDADAITWFVDGGEYFRFTRQPGYGSAEWPFDRRFHLILNIAVGGTWGGAQGIDEAIFPQTMEIEHVRIYRRAESGPPAPVAGHWMYIPKQ
jgi:beta-glucanase (GH16 family)